MIYVILVNWKGYRDTIECLESLARMDKVQFRVIVVDNESDPDGVEQVANWARGGLQIRTARHGLC